jgi:hypothetical protein
LIDRGFVVSPSSLFELRRAAYALRMSLALTVIVARAGLPAEAPQGRRLVEPRGIEPLTSSLRTRRSPS